jgi:hypothetical protein
VKSFSSVAKIAKILDKDFGEKQASDAVFSFF